MFRQSDDKYVMQPASAHNRSNGVDFQREQQFKEFLSNNSFCAFLSLSALKSSLSSNHHQHCHCCYSSSNYRNCWHFSFFQSGNETYLAFFLQFNINSIARCYVCRCRARFSSIHSVMFSSFAMNCKPYEVKKNFSLLI